MDLRFYHLTSSTLEATLPKLLTATLARDKRALLRFGSNERAKWFDDHLWTFSDREFLPHGSQGGEQDQHQPILIADHKGTNINQAAYIFWVDGFCPDDFKDWDQWALDGEAEVLSIVFSARDEVQLGTARALYRVALDLPEVQPAYWKQDDEGRWAKAN